MRSKDFAIQIKNGSLAWSHCYEAAKWYVIYATRHFEAKLTINHFKTNCVWNEGVNPCGGIGIKMNHSRPQATLTPSIQYILARHNQC